jgi:predicted kinase
MLILLNGPPASGKSTLAQRYVDDHSLALNLDIDRVRAMLGRWAEHPIEAGLAARALTLAMARTHLRAGHDVIIPQYLGRPDFLEQLDELAGAEGIRLHEIVLLDSRSNLLRRFRDRPDGPVADDAELAEMYDRLLRIVEQRPNARIVSSADGQVDETYRRLLAALEQ